MFKENSLNEISLRWKAQKRDYTDDGTFTITYEKEKERTDDLKSFMIEEQSKGAEIFVDFFINGIDFTKEVIGHHYSNTLSYYCNTSKNRRETIPFPLLKIFLKRTLGQLLDLEECMDCERYYHSDWSTPRIKEQGECMMLEENKDTLLYCSACCGDRLCGYYGIQVYHTASTVIWQMGMSDGIQKNQFSKENYFGAFKEFIDFVNEGLEGLALKKIDIHEMGQALLGINERLDLLKKKYKIERDTFDYKKLKELFCSASIEEIDTGIYLAAKLGFDLEKIKQDMENDYNHLAKNEQDAISWKIIDTMPYYDSVDLQHHTIAVKAHLLYN